MSLTSASPTRVGFLGLGRMGRAMATRLLKAGVEVVVWNRSSEPISALIAQGAIEAHSPEEALATGHVFSMLATEDADREVFSPLVLAAAPPGLIHVNHATISARAAREFAEAHHGFGHYYVAAPVIGRPDVADQGQLTILAGGDPEAIERSRFELETIGKRVWIFGEDPASANVAKIAVNFLIIHALQGLAESVTLLEQHGLDPQILIDAISDSIFPGAVYGGYGRGIVTQDYLPAGFTTILGRKDLLLALEAAEDAGISLPSAAVLRSVFDTRIAEGHGELDWSAIAEVTRGQASHAI